ncbi:uncharacterized protein LOC126676944 [Mercurialis annua]|uniref:uncharacterized protein LOC126676944 n=1 Tax=Mercurialis annua TaxID=3986 RepID=UPI00215FF549|nr:uncharacterized protein LOC126676944 [Mercurialis annua]
MKGAKRFSISESEPATNDTAFRNKRIISGSSFDVHRAETSQQQSTSTTATRPPLDVQRAETSRQHVRALNTQFASWVQAQLKDHPDELWEDGVRDYLTHASNIMERFSDVVKWIKANSVNGGTTADSLTAGNKSMPEIKNKESKLFQGKPGFASPASSTTFTASWNSGVFSKNQASGPALFNSHNSVGAFSNTQSSGGAFSNSQSSGGAFANSQSSGGAFANSQSSGGAFSNSQSSGGAFANSQISGGAFANSQSSGGAFANSQSSGGAISNSQSQSMFSNSQTAGLFLNSQSTGLFSKSQSSGFFPNSPSSVASSVSQTSGLLFNNQSPGVFSFTNQNTGLFPSSQSSAASSATHNSGLFSNNQSTGMFSKAPAPFSFGDQNSAPTNLNSSNDIDDENELEQPSSPSVKKSEEKGIVVVHEMKCKLYVKSSDTSDKDTWKDKGMGQLSIKCKEGVDKGTKESKPTIIVRNDVGRVVLNALLYPGIKTNMQKNSVVAIFHTAADDSGDNDSVVARTFLMRTKTEEDRDKLATAIQEYAPAS